MHEIAKWTIKTKRLLIQPATMADLDAINQLLSSPKLIELSGLMLAPDPMLRKWALSNWIKQGFIIAVKLISGELVGIITLFPSGTEDGQLVTNQAELGYLLKENLWHQGLMSEALLHSLSIVVKHAKLTSLVAEVNLTNQASRQILNKLGFRPMAQSETFTKMIKYF